MTKKKMRRTAPVQTNTAEAGIFVFICLFFSLRSVSAMLPEMRMTLIRQIDRHRFSEHVPAFISSRVFNHQPLLMLVGFNPFTTLSDSLDIDNSPGSQSESVTDRVVVQ